MAGGGRSSTASMSSVQRTVIARATRAFSARDKDANYGSNADWPEIFAEVAKADNFSPKLQHWIFATTAPVDAALQKMARVLSVERRELAHPIHAVEAGLLV